MARAGRIIRRVIAYGLIGLIVNVLVAWACAVWGRIDNAKQLKPSDRVSSLVMGMRARTMELAAQHAVSEDLKQMKEDEWDAAVASGFGIYAIRDYRAWFIDNCAVECGWPLSTLAWYEIFDVRLHARYRDVIGRWSWITLPAWWDRDPVLESTTPVDLPFALPRRVPIRPLPVGLAVNTVVYGIAARLLVAGLVSMRRAIRHRRGLCPSCAYDLRGDHAGGCPECGWGRAGPTP